MAKATAICRCATCGKEFTVTAFRRNTREARDFEVWASEHIDECDPCKQQRQADAKAAEAAERAWPELTGSEKQIAWAIKIRSKLAQDLEEEYANCVDQVKMSFDILAAEQTTASYWIDNRDDRAKVRSAVILNAKKLHAEGKI